MKVLHEIFAVLLAFACVLRGFFALAFQRVARMLVFYVGFIVFRVVLLVFVCVLRGFYALAFQGVARMLVFYVGFVVLCVVFLVFACVLYGFMRFPSKELLECSCFTWFCCVVCRFHCFCMCCT